MMGDRERYAEELRRRKDERLRRIWAEVVRRGPRVSRVELARALKLSPSRLGDLMRDARRRGIAPASFRFAAYESKAKRALERAGQKRLRELVRLLDQGLTQTAIARRWGVSRARVSQLVQRARRRGLLDGGEPLSNANLGGDNEQLYRRVNGSVGR